MSNKSQGDETHNSLKTLESVVQKMYIKSECIFFLLGHKETPDFPAGLQ